MADAEGGWHPGHNPWLIALTVTLATFMEVLDTSIANVALPHVAGSLSVSQDESTWVLTSYLVSNAIVLPISGWLASRVGRKRFYMTCVALFTTSSFLCGIAPNLPLLIFFRVLQGIGGGGLGPSEQSILADTFPPAKRGMAFAVYGMAVVLAPAIGPTLGGFITDNYSWRWVFFINVPVGILSLILSNVMVQDPPWASKQKKSAIDVVGLGLIAVGLGSLEVVLDKGQEDDWFHSSFITGFALVAATSLVSFVIWELHTENPVVDVRLFRNRTFAAANAMMVMLGITLYGTTVLLPQFTQTLLGYSAQDAGEALSPGGVLVICMMPFVGQLVSRVDGRKMIAFGFVCLAGSLVYMATHLSLDMDFRTATWLRLYQSFGMAFLFVPISTLSYVGVPKEKNNAVAGMVNLSRNMGGDIGIAFVTTMLARRASAHQSDLTAHATMFDAPFRQRLAGAQELIFRAGSTVEDASRKAYGMVYATVERQARTLAYVDVLWLMAFAVFAMVPLAFAMKKPTPGAAPAGAH